MSTMAAHQIRDLLATTSTPTLTYLLEGHGYRNTYLGGLHPLGRAERAVGRARTLRYTPHRPDLIPPELARNPQRLAIESIQQNEILVVEAGSELGAGVLGDVLLSRLVTRNAVAFVVDGAVRDGGAIRDFEIPVFARGVHGAAHMRELVPVEHDGTIRCSGCTVVPGDWIVCDEHGVTAVPAALAAEVAAEGAKSDLQEDFIRELIEGGASTIDVYPPDKTTLEGFPEWQSRHGLS